jgi:hypothetical protein
MQLHATRSNQQQPVRATIMHAKVKVCGFDFARERCQNRAQFPLHARTILEPRAICV